MLVTAGPLVALPTSVATRTTSAQSAGVASRTAGSCFPVTPGV